LKKGDSGLEARPACRRVLSLLDLSVCFSDLLPLAFTLVYSACGQSFLALPRVNSRERSDRWIDYCNGMARLDLHLSLVERGCFMSRLCTEKKKKRMKLLSGEAWFAVRAGTETYACLLVGLGACSSSVCPRVVLPLLLKTLMRTTYIRAKMEVSPG